MKNSKALFVLPLMIAALALVAAALGAFWQGSGEPIEFTSVFGETYFLQGRGVYQHDTVNYAAQAKSQDIITLFLGIPLLVTGVILNRKETLRGRLILTGALGYFLYTYTSLVFLAAYSSFFLIYLALFSMSLFSFILAMMGLKPDLIAERVTRGFPRPWIITFQVILSIFLLIAWLGLIVPSLTSGGAPSGLETYTTLVIQALDLGIIVPASLLSAYLLWKKQAWGYALSFVVMIKGSLMGAAIIAMIIGQALAGVAFDPVMAAVFSLICVCGMGLAAVMLKNIR